MFRGVVAGLLLFISASVSADTLINTGCSKDYPGVQWFIWEDENGNRYSTKNRRSWECGFSRTLTLSTVKEQGDRFDPVILDINYVDMLGRDEPWGMVHHSTTIGKAVRTGRDTVEIYGDGRIGDGIFTLGREEIQFRIEPEPVCEVDHPPYLGGGGIDCEGHRQNTGQDLIYYSEEDDKIVTWELGIMIYATHRKYGIDVPIKILEEYDVDSSEWEEYEKRVEKYNEVYEKSGVHIRYKLTKLYLSHWHSLGDLRNMSVGLPVDIVLGRNTSYPDTCGVARVTRYFSEGKPPSSMSKCTIYTDLHEMGHSVGLAHGPENQAYQASGYLFPEYGHGWNDICNNKDDLMSYGWEGIFHSNSKLNCTEIFKVNSSSAAGGVQWSDTAKALNRIRYNVSLIYRENDHREEDARLRPVYSRSIRKEIEIID